MRNLAAAALLPCLLFGIAGCGASGPEGLIQEQIGIMNEMADLLESDASQEEVDKKMKDLEKRGDEIEKKLEALDVPDDEKKRLMEKYQPELEKALGRVMKAGMGRAFQGLGNPGG